jgi:formylglycine-generating enzyme required for sulfatase activity
MASTPVTNGQYLRFVKATGYRRPALIDVPGFNDPSLPVVMVSWDDAIAYAKWAGGRLPSELEWEIAARAGEVKNVYPWGENPPLNTQANIDGLSNGPTPVSSYPTGANAWGIHDASGNVWEWCADVWDPALLRNAASASLSNEGATSEQRAIRGGSFESPAITGRSNFRHYATRSEARADLGFRVVYDSV